MNNEYEAIYDIIKQASDTNQLVVFIGAGMSNNFGFPTWNDLIMQMYRELTGKEVSKKKFSSDELLRIPQALWNKDKAAYKRILRANFGAHKVQDSANVILDEIMKLKPAHIITTNFDTLIEKYISGRENALYKSHSAQEGYAKLVQGNLPYRYMSVINDMDMVTADANHLLMKLHGDVQNMNSLVLCEDDYLNFSDSHILMENFIKSLLTNHTFLFVGYGVGDSNLKLIMKWVDNIVARQQTGEDKRKKHILLYSEKSNMDKFQKEYFEHKQIEVLVFSNLPVHYRRQEITELEDERGKRMLSMLRAIVPSRKEIVIDDKKLQDVFMYFKDRKFVHIRELSSIFGESRYELEKMYTKLLVVKDTAGGNLAEAIIKEANSKGNRQLSIDARGFMGKLEVDGYRYGFRYYNTKEDNMSEVSYIYDGFLEDACMVSDYIGLYDHVKKNKAYSFTEKACWAMYTDNSQEADKWLERQWKSKEKMDLYGQLRFAYNAHQNYEIEKRYNVDFGTLWMSIPEIERERQCILDEYISGCVNLYHEFGGITDKLRLRYSVGQSVNDWGHEQIEFAICRTAILDLTRTLILNGFYITGLWSTTVSYDGFTNLMRSYADMIFFLISAECRHKPEWFQILPWDVYLLLNLIEHNDLKKLLDKYRISRMDLDEYVRGILWENCMNLLTFCQKRISGEWPGGHLSSERIESCMMLMNLVEWNRDEIGPIAERMFIIWQKVIPLDRDTRRWAIKTSVFNTFLSKQYHSGSCDVISPYAENALKQILHDFLKEDHLNKYSKTLEVNVETCADVESLSNLIDRRNNHISKRLIGQCWNCYRKWYRGSASWLWVSLYPMAGTRVRKEITALVNARIRGMEMQKLRAYIEQEIISYSYDVEAVLVDACRRFAGLSEEQRERTLNTDRGGCPLTHVLRLWQNEKIPSIDVFREFKELDPWFSFVCFPEEFDYRRFKVKEWYSWLENERYRGKAFQRSREYLKDEFKEAMENGAEEDLKRIYYKYIE